MKIKILIIILLFTLGGLSYIYYIGANAKKRVNNQFYIEVHGNSMYPTLKNLEKYKIEKIDGCDGNIKRGDIVMFDILGSNVKYIKRAEILPGDKYEIGYENNGGVLNLTLNGNYLLKFKSYLNTKFYKVLLLWSNNTDKGTINAKQYGVFGDNKNNSVDTLEYGFIGCTKITHRVLGKY